MIDSDEYEYLPEDHDEALLVVIERVLYRTVLEFADTADAADTEAAYAPWVHAVAIVNGVLREMPGGRGGLLRAEPSEQESWPEWRRRVESDLRALQSQLAFRTKRGRASVSPVELASDHRSAILGYTRKIRGLLAQLEIPQNLRELLLKRLSKFEAAVELDRTPYDAWLTTFLDTTKAIGEGADNLRPVMDLLERVAGIMRTAEGGPKLLPEPEKNAGLLTHEGDENSATLVRSASSQ